MNKTTNKSSLRDNCWTGLISLAPVLAPWEAWGAYFGLKVFGCGFDLNSLQHSFIHSQNIHCNIKEYIMFSEYNPFLVNPAPRPLVLLKVLSSPGKSSTQQLFVSLPTESSGVGTKHWN